MKKQLSLVLFGIVSISLTGCYTQVAVQEDDDCYVYHEPQPIIILLPAPYPPPVPVPPPGPIIPFPENPPKKEKIRKPATPPPSNDRIRDDLRNSGGRNEGGRRKYARSLEIRTARD